MLIQGLSLNSEVIDLSSLANGLAPRICCLSLLSYRVTDKLPHPPSNYVGTGDLNVSQQQALYLLSQLPSPGIAFLKPLRSTACQYKEPVLVLFI